MLDAAPEARGADDLLGAVQLLLDPEPTLSRRVLDRLVPLAAGRVGRARRGASGAPLARRSGGRGTRRGRDARRAAAGGSAAAAPARACGPTRPRRRRRARSATPSPRPCPLRARSLGPRTGAARRRGRRARRRSARRAARARGGRVPAARAGRRRRRPRTRPRPRGPARPAGARPRRPSTCSAQLVDVAQELVDARPVAVRHRAEQRAEPAAADRLARRQARKGGGVAVAVALRAHPLLSDRLRPRPPGASRARVGIEDRDLAALDAAVQQRHVGDKPAEPAADDRDATVHDRAT